MKCSHEVASGDCTKTSIWIRFLRDLGLLVTTSVGSFRNVPHVFAGWQQVHGGIVSILAPITITCENGPFPETIPIKRFSIYVWTAIAERESGHDLLIQTLDRDLGRQKSGRRTGAPHGQIPISNANRPVCFTRDTGGGSAWFQGSRQVSWTCFVVYYM